MTDDPGTTLGLDEDGVDHVVCDCDENTALCGADVTGLEWVDDDEGVPCTLCAILEGCDCPVCGRKAPDQPDEDLVEVLKRLLSAGRITRGHALHYYYMGRLP